MVMFRMLNSVHPDLSEHVYPFTPVQLYRPMTRWKKVSSQNWIKLIILQYRVGQDIDYKSSKEPLCWELISINDDSQHGSYYQQLLQISIKSWKLFGKV